MGCGTGSAAALPIGLVDNRKKRPMKLCLTTRQRIAGMTLVETMIAASIGSAVIGAMVLGSVSFQQLSNGADEYYKATSDQMRVLDSIALDMRRATGGSVSN